MSDQSLTGQLALLAIAVAAPIALGVIQWFSQRTVRQVDDQIKGLAEKIDGCVTRDEWLQSRSDAKEERDRMLVQIRELYQRDEKMRDDLLREMKELRNDLNGGLNAIRDQLSRLKA